MFPCLLLACLAFAAPATAPTVERGHDPWIFRCALDRQPRMVVAALAPNWWLAFDAQSCRIYKVWRGQIRFTGTVYDTRHGPQPQSVGDPLLSSGPPLAGGDAPVRWRGYRLVNGQVVFGFEVGGAAVELTPVFIPSDADGTTAAIEWRFDVADLPAGQSVDIPLQHSPTATGPDRVRLDRNGWQVIRTEFTP